MDGRKPLLRLRDILEAVGMPKSTVRDWLADFAAFIPSARDGSILYYRPEALDVLKVVQELRSDGLSKSQIVQALVDRGFSLNVEPPVSIEGAGTVWDINVQTVAVLSEHTDRIVALEQQVQELRAELATSRKRRTWWPFT